MQVQKFYFISESLFCNSYFIAISVYCYLHVDVNGGGGLVCNASESICTESQVLHNRIHCC